MVSFPHLDSVASILPGVLHKRGLRASALAAHVILEAGHWLGTALPQFSDSLHPRRFSDGLLLICADNSVAVQECQALLPALTEYLERQCKGAVVREIRVTRS